MSVTTTSRRSSVTCIFEDLERKSHAQFNVNTDKVENSSREMAILQSHRNSPIYNLCPRKRISMHHVNSHFRNMF